MRPLFIVIFSLCLLGAGCAKPTPATPTPKPGDRPVAEGDCQIGGCSGELCGDKKDGPLISTCEIKQGWDYQNQYPKVCKRQENGKCGWIYY